MAIKGKRKFGGKVFTCKSEGWDTRSHALRSLPRGFEARHYIRFTIEGDEYVMWVRPKPKSRR